MFVVEVAVAWMDEIGSLCFEQFEISHDGLIPALQSIDPALIGVDPWGSTALIEDMKARRMPIVEVRQGYRQLSEATKKILTMRPGVLKDVQFDAMGNAKPKGGAKDLALVSAVSIMDLIDYEPRERRNGTIG